MAADDADVALDGFLEVENRFASFLRAVPPSSEHNSVHSPILASILLDSCSLIETVLKSTMDNSRYEGIARITQHRSRRYTQTPPFLNIGDLRSVFKGDTLYAKPVWFLPRGKRSFPWYKWRQSTGNPTWWAGYNAVKHSRFGNARQAKLLTTMHALKGLFLVLVQSLEFRQRLVERGVIRCEGATAQKLRADAASWEPLPTKCSEPVIAVSSLLGYKFLSAGSGSSAGSLSVFI